MSKGLENERLYFKINGEDVKPIPEKEDKENCITHKYKGEVDSSKNINTFEVKDKREYSIKDDNVKLFRVHCLTKDMDISVSYPENVGVSFFNLGLINNFEKNHVEHNRYISRVHKEGIILPYQGFGLSFRKL